MSSTFGTWQVSLRDKTRLILFAASCENGRLGAEGSYTCDTDTDNTFANVDDNDQTWFYCSREQKLSRYLLMTISTQSPCVCPASTINCFAESNYPHNTNCGAWMNAKGTTLPMVTHAQLSTDPTSVLLARAKQSAAPSAPAPASSTKKTGIIPALPKMMSPSTAAFTMSRKRRRASSSLQSTT